MRNAASLLLLSLVGCSSFTLMPEETPTQQVATNPFAPPRKFMPGRVNAPPAPFDVAWRVENVRGQVVGANRDKIGLQPNVATLSSPSPEIFHNGVNQIYITDSLVRQCQTDGQLAALLANELGRMIAENERGVSDSIRNPDHLPPIALPIGTNNSGVDSDPLRQIEMARYERNHPRNKKTPPANPQAIARAILERAGYSATELDAATPVLQLSERNTMLEDQFRGTIKQSDWQPY